MQTYRNTLLAALPSQIIAKLELKPVRFELEHEFECPGNPIQHLFFVEEGVASITTSFADGSQVEVGMFGFESVIGVSALMGTKRSLNRVYTQIPGWGYSSPMDAVRREFAQAGTFHAMALGYVQAQLVQTMQSAGCNAKHSLEQRLARWLLTCADRANTDRFALSQEYLADMLGSTRSTVSLAAALFKQEGLIEYTRGQIHILDACALEKRACECYGVIKEHLDSYVYFDSGLSPDAGPKVA